MKSMKRCPQCTRKLYELQNFYRNRDARHTRCIDCTKLNGAYYRLIKRSPAPTDDELEKYHSIYRDIIALNGEPPPVYFKFTGTLVVADTEFTEVYRNILKGIDPDTAVSKEYAGIFTPFLPLLTSVDAKLLQQFVEVLDNSSALDVYVEECTFLTNERKDKEPAVQEYMNIAMELAEWYDFIYCNEVADET